MPSSSEVPWYVGVNAGMNAIIGGAIYFKAKPYYVWLNKKYKVIEPILSSAQRTYDCVLTFYLENRKILGFIAIGILSYILYKSAMFMIKRFCAKPKVRSFTRTTEVVNMVEGKRIIFSETEVVIVRNEDQEFSRLKDNLLMEIFEANRN